MTKLIPILSGRCLVVEMPEGAKDPRIETNQSVIPYGQDLAWYINGGDKSYGMDETEWVSLPPGNWHIIGMLSEVTESEAALVVPIHRQSIIGDVYKNFKTDKWDAFDALESLDSAILAEGYVFENPYGSHPDTWDYLFEAMHHKPSDVRKWEAAQSHALDRSRCLLLGREGDNGNSDYYETLIAYTDADPPDIDYEKEMPHKQWPSTKYVARNVDNGWTHVSDALPEHLETVWLSNGKGFTTLGCLVWAEGGWHWAATNGVIYEENGRIVSECESDDIDAEYWHRLPDALKIDKEVKK